MYAVGRYNKWEEQYVYEAFATELPAKQIQMAIEQLEAVGTDTDSCVIVGEFNLVCAAVYTLKDLQRDELYYRLLKDATRDTRTFTRDERKKLIGLLRDFKLEEHEVTKRIPQDVTPVFDASGKMLNDCYVSLLKPLAKFFWAQAGWPKGVRVESDEMDQPTFEKRLREADPKLADRLLPLVDFDYTKGRCQESVWGHISTGSRFFSDDYVIKRHELPEPFNKWTPTNGTVGLLLRIKDPRLYPDDNAVFALTAAHCVFQELIPYAFRNDQEAVDLIGKFNNAVRYAHFDTVSPPHLHGVTLDYALLRINRVDPEPVRLRNFCRGNLVDINGIPVPVNDPVIKVGNSSGITLGRFYNAYASLTGRFGVAMESFGRHPFMMAGDSGALCCWFDMERFGAFVPLAILSSYSRDGRTCVGSDVFLCLQNYVFKNRGYLPDINEVNRIFEVYVPIST